MVGDSGKVLVCEDCTIVVACEKQEDKVERTINEDPQGALLFCIITHLAHSMDRKLHFGIQECSLAGST